MARHEARRHSPLKILILVVVCSLVGGGVVYKYREPILGMTHDASSSLLPERKKSRKETPAESTPDADISKMKRAQLESEVTRLRDQLAQRDRENTDMKIELKLLKEGSHTKD